MKLRRIVALMASIAILASACSAGSTPSPSAAPSVSTAPSSAAPASAAAPSASASTPELDAIRARGTLQVGLTATYRPWDYYEGSTIVGLDPDIVAIFAKDLGVQPDLIDTDWTGVVASLNTKKFDTIISALTYTADRGAAISFTQPYGDLKWVFLVKSGSGFTKASDLEGKTISVEQGGATETLLEQLNKQGHNFKILSINGLDATYAALESGRADAVLDALPGILYFIKNNAGYSQFEVDPSLGVSWTSIGVRKSDPDLCNFLNDELTKIKSDGRLSQIETKWLGSYMDEPATVPDYQVCS
jgi:polar amino acid transport system substrate-binding protein